MKTLTLARRLLLCGCLAAAAMLGTAQAGDGALASKLQLAGHEQGCVDQGCCPAVEEDCSPGGPFPPGYTNERCAPAGDCVQAVHQGSSKSTVDLCWFKKDGWFNKDKSHAAGDCCPTGHGGQDCCATGCTSGPGCNPADGHACCINRTGSCANGTCTCEGCKNGTGCMCCGTGQYSSGYGHSGCKCGSGCQCGQGFGNHGLIGKLLGTQSDDCRCGPGCRCGRGNGGGFLADLNGDGHYDSAGYGRCRHCGRYGNLFGLGHCGICCGIPLPGIPIPACFAGHGGALGGVYSRVYAVNPYHHDFRDGAIYAAQGYNAPIAVPLAPNVDYQWNYGWGIPSSRLSPVSRVVPSPYAVQPTYAVPAGYAPAGGYPDEQIEGESDS